MEQDRMQEGEKECSLENKDAQKAINDLLEAVPEDKKGTVYRALTIIQQESYEGPIPHPRIIREYERILPGSADRILSMAEKQQEHRMALETKAIGGQVDQSKRGQLFGFILVFVCVAVAVFFAVYFGMTAFAVTFLCVTMVSVVGLFVTGKMTVQKDLAKKSKDQEH